MQLSVVLLPLADGTAPKRCLNAFAAQERADAISEILLPTTAASADLGGDSLPFEVVPIELGGGATPAALRNEAVARSRGDAVLFVDGDLVPAPRLVEGHLAAHVRSGSSRTLAGQRSPLPALALSPLLAALEATDERVVLDRNPGAGEPGWLAFHCGHASAPRALLAQNPFDERFETGRVCDLELGYRLARTGHGVDHQPELVCWGDAEIGLDDFLARQRSYGADLTRLDSELQEQRLAEAVGLGEAQAVDAQLPEAFEAVEALIERLEAPLRGIDLRSPNARRVLGTNETTRVLDACYAALARRELVAGAREAQALGPLTAPR